MSVEAIGLKETLAFFRSIDRRIDNARAYAITSPSALKSMKSAAVDIMQSVVYDRYVPAYYDRTYAMKDSISATNDGEGVASVGLPMSAALASIAGESAGANTYAIFMLPEFASQSFFRGRAAGSIPRDFLTTWHEMFGESIPEILSQALSRELLK